MMIFNFCFTKNPLFWASILFVLFFLACKSENTPSAKTKINAIEIAEKPIDKSIEIPKGDELKLEAQRIDANQFKVKVTNVSDRKVYCYYTSSPNGDRASFHYYPEKRKQNSNGFEKYGDGPDSLPALSSINPNQSIEFNFSAFEKGDYRLTISYLIDENTAKLMTEKIPPEWNETEEELVAKSIKRITSPVMTMTLNKN